MKVAASLLLGLALLASPALTGPRLHAQSFGRFAAYEHCHLPDNLTLVENTPLAKGIEGRTVKTVMGSKNVPLIGGTRLLYAYPGTEPFANVKVEQIPADSYKQARQDLIANFEQILTGDDSSTRNYSLKPRLNGLEIYGLDRRKLEGNTLGIYLFFVDRTHTAVTVFFLNADPTLRKFSSLEEYAPLRDAFINTYTHCAAGGTAGTAVITAAKLPPTAPTGESIASTIPADRPAPATAAPEAALPDAPLPNGAAAAKAAPAASAAAEPVAKAVIAKKTTPAKAGAKAAAKPAHATDAKKAPASKPDAKHPAAKKPAPAGEKAKSEKDKPATPKKKKPAGD